VAGSAVKEGNDSLDMIARNYYEMVSRVFTSKRRKSHTSYVPRVEHLGRGL
jgi:hypothetical protein